MSANIGAACETARHVSVPPLFFRTFRKPFWEKPTRKGFSISSSGNLSAIALRVVIESSILRILLSGPLEDAPPIGLHESRHTAAT